MAKIKRQQQSKSEVPKVITVATSRCPTCGSTDRDPYYGVKTMAHGGITADGDLYTHVVWRRTRCCACGQIRIDKSFESRNRSDSEQII